MSITIFGKSGNRDFYGSSTIRECVKQVPPTVATQGGGVTPLRNNLNIFNCVDDLRSCIYALASEESSITDYSYFYVEALEEGQIIDFRLEKLNSGGEFTAAITNNGTDATGAFSANEGEVMQVGSYVDYELRASLKVNWKGIYDQAALGEGVYRIVVYDSIESRRLYSYPYRLLDYDCGIADKTVKIKWEYEGIYPSILQRPEFDASIVSNNTFPDEIRLLGEFKPTFEFTSDETFVMLNDGSSKKARSKESEKFLLTIGDITYELLMTLYRWGLKSKEIKVSSFSNNSLYLFSDVEVTNNGNINVPVGTNTRFIRTIPRAEFVFDANQVTYRNC